MLAYAASRPRAGSRRSSPNALLAIIALHVGALAVLMSTKMDLPKPFIGSKTVVTFVPTPQPPPPNDRVAKAQPHPTVFTPTPQVPLPLPDPQFIVPLPQDPIVSAGPRVDPRPLVVPRPQPLPARIGAKLLTPQSELKPPYPQSKLLAEEEATLKLRLTIDERGLVIAVEPTGPADAAFLDSARRYLIAHWRYRPASEGGRATSSTEVITLRFQLDG